MTSLHFMCQIYLLDAVYFMLSFQQQKMDVIRYIMIKEIETSTLTMQSTRAAFYIPVQY